LPQPSDDVDFLTRHLGSDSSVCLHDNNILNPFVVGLTVAKLFVPRLKVRQYLLSFTEISSYNEDNFWNNKLYKLTE